MACGAAENQLGVALWRLLIDARRAPPTVTRTVRGPIRHAGRGRRSPSNAPTQIMQVREMDVVGTV